MTLTETKPQTKFLGPNGNRVYVRPGQCDGHDSVPWLDWDRKMACWECGADLFWEGGDR